MKRHLLVLLIACLLAVNVYGQYTGDGTIANPWHIGDGGGGSNPPTSSVKAYVDIPSQTLYITYSGSGQSNMADFWSSLGGEAPWNPNAPYYYPNNSSIKNVNIQSGVTNIGERAFKDCSNLQTIIIPNTVTKINKQAFFNCINANLQITIPDKVATIEGEAFRNCRGKMTIESGDNILHFTGFYYNGTEYPQGWKYDWFKDCQIKTLEVRRDYDYQGSTPPFCGMFYLENLTIGNKVTQIGGEAFAQCSNLINVTIDNGPTDLTFTTSNYGNFFNESPFKTLYLGRNIVYYTSSAYIPFRGKTSLITLTLGNNVRSIGYQAFQGCSGLSAPVTIPTSVTSIGESAFDGCVLLSAVTIGTNVETIGAYAFNQCHALNSIIIPNKVVEIDGGAFSKCTNLTNFTIENGPTDLTFTTSNYGDFFNESPIKILHLGRNIVYYTSSAYIPFRNKTSLVTLTLGDNVRSIGYQAFQGCSGLSSPVTIPTSVTSIGESAFDGCLLLSAVTIGANVETIGTNAFNQCRAITTVTIPNKVTSIDGGAFANCDKLVNVTIENGTSVLTFSTTGYGNHFNQTPIKSLYLGRNIAFYTSTTYVPFRDKTSMTTLSIGYYVTEIPNYAFYGCCGLEEIICYPTVPPKIYENTFGGCGKSIPNCKVYVPESSLHLYKSAEGWNDFEIIEGLGISDVSVISLQIFPNPAITEIFIKSDLQIEKVEIYSITGALLKIENNFKEKILVADLAKGIYFLKAHTDNGVTVGKFVKE
jgi:predicted transport protein